MKIFPGRHKICIADETIVNNIPLAYYSDEVADKYLEITVEERFNHCSSEKTVYPYQSFNKDDILFFDAAGKALADSSSYLKHQNNKYIFEPVNSVEFIPEQFQYSIVYRRNDNYTSDQIYKLKVGCYSIEMAEELIGLFNSKSPLKPANIEINNGALYPASLINLKIAGLDFLFARKSELTEDAIEFYLENHVNLWIFDDSEDELFIEDQEIEKYDYLDAMVYSNNIYPLYGYDRVKTDAARIEKLYPDFNNISLFKNESPVALLHSYGSAFMVISHVSMETSLDTCYGLIFEIMMNIYLNGYFETRTRTESITDNKLDYLIRPVKKHDWYHPRINKKEIFYQDELDENANYEYYRLKCNRDDIEFIGTDRDSNYMFKKTSSTDPKKDKDSISIFTVNNTVINYSLTENVIKTIEDKLNLSYKEINDKDYLVIEPYRSSEYGIDLYNGQMIEIRNKNKHVLYYDKSQKIFGLIDEKGYDEAMYGDKFASIQMTTDSSFACNDMRIYGGGEIDASENYEMIDTGYLYGRPYRIGSVMVIRLPYRFKEYKDNIKSEISKHIASGDYPIIVYV